ncbi:MAG: cell division protein FtsZ [Proteobacteria bacterium]|nr:MAG: cell division protein FtsZ [Pseudomonadota bacterium]
MALNLSMPETDELKPKITVFGVGGAGGNAVNNMIEKQLEGTDFVVANTDAQALSQSKADARIQLGIQTTHGLGAGAKASIGAQAAEESMEQIVDHLAGSHMCFITAGMGGGTGTGAAPIIAAAARELGVLTVGVVTKPFMFEGAKRMRQAEAGVEALQKVVDTLIIIPNQNLFRLANENTTFTEAFTMADDVLYQGVKGVTDLMVRPGLINLDFADVKSVMDEMGKAMMGTGEAAGEGRAQQAAEKAIANPLLDEISLHGARGVLINITGGYDLTLFELDEAANVIRDKVDPDANIIVGSTLDDTMEGNMRVSVVATGIDAAERREPIPQPVRAMTAAPVAAPVVSEEPVEEPAAAAPVAEMVERDAEPELFDDAFIAGVDAQDEIAVEEHAQSASDDLPPPAYTPRPTASVDTPAESFVAPKPGTPSPEALARLRAAVDKGEPRGAAARPAAPSAAPRVSAEDDEPRRSFGFTGLINRMSGAAEGAVAKPRPAPIPQDDPAMEDDQSDDRIEIPAFLRRQAN